MGMGGGGADVSNAVNQISEMVELGLKFGEFQTQQGMRFGEQKVQQGIRFGEDQTDKGLNYGETYSDKALGELKQGVDMGKAEMKEGFERYQALNAPYRLAAYNALDGLMDTMGMARLNVSSADMANALDKKAQLSGAQQRLQASGTNLLRNLPANMDPNVRKQIEYSIQAGVDPSAIAQQLPYFNPAFSTDRDRSATQFENFRFQNANASVPRVEGEGGSGGGGMMSSLSSFGGMGGQGGAGGSSKGSLSPSDNSVFNSPDYLNPAQRSTVGSGSNRVFNPVNSYLADALSSYRDVQQAQNATNYNQQGLAAALMNGTYSQQPRVVDVF